MTRLAVVQARMGSSRLPGKVMAEVGGRPMIQSLLERLHRASRIDGITVATTTDASDDALASFVESIGVGVHRGSDHDVLSRVIDAAGCASSVVRITADCPLVDAVIVDMVCETFDRLHIDYASNVDPPSFPDGLDVEVVSTSALQRIAATEVESRFREHVTLAIRERSGFRRANVAASHDLSSLRWTVDEAADLQVVRGVFAHFHPRIDFSWLEVLALQRLRPEVFAPNASIVRNEGLVLDEQQKRGRSMGSL